MADLHDALSHQFRIVRDREHELQVALDTLGEIVNQIDDERSIQADAVADYQLEVRRLRAVKASQ